MSALSSLLLVGRATRLQKVLPLLVVVANAGLLAGGVPSLPRAAVAGLCLVVLSAAGMQINVLTDADLDRVQHPERMRWLARDPRVLTAVFGFEALAVLVGLGWLLASGAWMLAGATAAYGFFFILYSYNFLAPGSGVRSRLKLVWWGNVLTVIGGYYSLWLVGFSAAPPPPATLPRWCVLAGFVCIADYGMFVNDCAKDSVVERAHGLRTLPALLGAVRCSQLAAGLVGVGVLGAASCGVSLLDGARAVALGLYLVVQTATAVLVTATVARREGRSEAWVDAAFWVSRVGMLALLLGGRA